MSTMQWHSSCICAQRILILSRSIEELALSSSHLAWIRKPPLLSSLPTSELMVTSAMPELMSSSSMDRRPLPPSLHGTCRLSGLIYGLRPCLTQQASRRTPLCWSLANRDSSGRTKLAMDAARWASLVPGALLSWDRRIRTAWWALCKRFMPTSLSTPLTGNFPRPHSRSLLAHRTFLRSCDPSKPPAGPTCRLHSRFRTWKGELLRLTLKRRKLPHPSFDPMSEFPIYPRVTAAEANHCFWGYCGSRTNRTFAWYGTNQHGAFIQICNTTSKIRLRLPHTGCEEVFQDGYRLVLLPKLAFYALWDGHGESFVVPRAATGVAEVALPIGSYASAPVDNSDPQVSGTGITGLPPATVTDPSCLPPVRLLRSAWSFSLVVGSLASQKDRNSESQTLAPTSRSHECRESS